MLKQQFPWRRYHPLFNIPPSAVPPLIYFRVQAIVLLKRQEVQTEPSEFLPTPGTRFSWRPGGPHLPSAPERSAAGKTGRRSIRKGAKSSAGPNHRDPSRTEGSLETFPEFFVTNAGSQRTLCAFLKLLSVRFQQSGHPPDKHPCSFIFML